MGAGLETYLKKIMNLPDAGKEVNRLKAAGNKVVFTNGCFDILHPGHTRYLCRARELGHYLIVALNSDRSVRAIKGDKRPVTPQDERAELLAALGCVDAVVMFDQDTPEEIIKYLLPDILVKGGDWQEEDIAGAGVVKAAGGKVERIPFVKGFSTSGIIDRIRGQKT